MWKGVKRYNRKEWQWKGRRERWMNGKEGGEDGKGGGVEDNKRLSGLI
jgi:hypothetical protein